MTSQTEPRFNFAVLDDEEKAADPPTPDAATPDAVADEVGTPDAVADEVGTPDAADPADDPADSSESPHTAAEPVEPVEPVEQAERAEAAEPAREPTTPRWRRLAALPRRVLRVPQARHTRRRVVAVLLGMVVLAAAGAGVAGWLALRGAATEQATAAALDAARTKLPMVLSYKASTLDADLDRARQQISGTFASRFDELAATLIVPTTRNQNITTTATVVRGAVIGGDADHVDTVLYVNQTTTSTAKPDAQKTASQVKVVMSDVGGQWLISEVTPI